MKDGVTLIQCYETYLITIQDLRLRCSLIRALVQRYKIGLEESGGKCCGASIPEDRFLNLQEATKCGGQIRLQL